MARLEVVVDEVASAIRTAEGTDLGEGLIRIREAGIDRLEPVFVDGVGRFDN